jgi:hypothetical protein
MEITIKGKMSVEELKLLKDNLDNFFIADFQIRLGLNEIILFEN